MSFPFVYFKDFSRLSAATDKKVARGWTDYAAMVTTRRNSSASAAQRPIPCLFMTTDMVNHPPHYTSHPSGIEAIQITRLCGFSLGNAIKYIWRYEDKNGAEDLKKARFYLNDVLTMGSCHYPPHKANELLQQAIDAETNTDRRQLLLHIRCGELRDAATLIDEILGESVGGWPPQ